MRSWKTALLRRTCAMFGNRCYFLLHHQRLFPMELVPLIPATMIILITVIIGTRVDAIRFADPFPSSFSSVISSGHYSPETILARIRMRRNASSYFFQRLRDFASNSKRNRKSNSLQANDVQNENDTNRQRFTDTGLSVDQNIQINKNQFTEFPFSNHAVVIGYNQQQALRRKKLKLPQRAQSMILTDSPSVQVLPKLIPSNFPRLTNRRDCNGSDCLKNNDAISLYIPRENNTNDGELPPLLLLSSNPSSSSNNRENRNLQQSATLKLPKLHTGIKILDSNVQQPQKSIPLSPSDVSYHISQANSRNYNEYGNVKLSEVRPIPPFAGGAELTDFIQPIDTTMQTHRIYGNFIPSAINRISSAAYSEKNKHYLLSSSGNRGVYGNLPSEPLIPLNSELGIYAPVTSSSPPSVYSTYSAQSIDFTSSPYYRSQYDLYSTAAIDDKASEEMYQGVTPKELINSENINANTYPSIQLTTTDYEPQLSAKEFGPGPPAAMPVMDNFDEQKQEPDTMEQYQGTSFDCSNIATTLAMGNDETNYGVQIEDTYGIASEAASIGTTTTATTTTTTITITTTAATATNAITTATTTLSVIFPCTMGITQLPKGIKQTFLISTTSTASPEGAMINETSREQARISTTERYETMAITYSEAVDDQITTAKQTVKPSSSHTDYAILFPQTTAPNVGAETEKEHKLKVVSKNNTIVFQPTSTPTPTQIPTFTHSSFNVTKTTNPIPMGIVPNRLRGKARLICKEDGLQFGINTLFPFTGQIFTRNRKPASECYFTFHEATFISIMMPYSTCGVRNIEEQKPEAQYHIQVIVIFQQKDNTSTMQTFLTQCVHQKIQYQKQVIPKHIEEAVEELRLIPTKLEHKAQVPECMMRIVTEEEHGHGDDGTEVEIVNLGQPMRIEWSLMPESDAYGFHVRNCTVRDTVSDEEYVVIDERGCSTDINIFSHPHYDTYHDIARVHWHAFKVPDINQLSIKCSIEICTDIPDTISGLTSCDSIPSPPFCPDLITSPTNVLLSDQEEKVIRKRREHKSFQQHVHADICFGDKKDEYCSSEKYQRDRVRHTNMFKDNSRKQYCLSRLWLSIWTGLSVLTMLLAISVYGYCRCSKRRRYASVKSVKQQQQ